MVSVSSATAPTPQAANDSGLKGFAQNFDSFLTLLTTQLKNQDPLSPMDATQFTTQLVQFTGVEQAIHQNQSLKTLISLQQDLGASTAVGYLGKQVATDGSKVQLSGGSASLNYILGGPSADTKVNILDSSGKIVRTLAGATSAGPHTLTWDGKGEDGVRLKDGTYSVQISARDSNNNPVVASAETGGIVTNVSFDAGKVYLTVGGKQYALSDIRSIRPGPSN